MLRMFWTNACSTEAWPARWVADDCAGNWKRPSAFWSPSLASKWLATTNTGWPWNVNSPTRGLRLDVHTGLVGSIRPGDSVRSGSPLVLTTCVEVMERLTDEAPRSTKV